MTGQSDSRGDLGLFADLAARFRDTLDGIVAHGRKIVLWDYPSHSNVGDSAIWLGERRYLAARGVRIRHTTDLWHLDLPRADPLTRGTLVLLHGGGSFGDTWPRVQDARESVVQRLRGVPIVQLPQTVHFESPALRDRARRVFEAHGDVTLLARDQRSLAYLRRWFDVRSILCPDAAFLLGDLRHRRPAPQRPVQVLGRTDVESSQDEPWPASLVADWVHDEPPRGLLRLQNMHYRVERYSQAPWITSSRLAVYDALARRHLGRGIDLLGEGSVVVTDRLHAHILCLLLGIEHVVVDNSYGKLSGFFETWTSSTGLAHWASTRGEALAMAVGLARDCQGARDPS
jgi:pyruvyl transferase EpsO